MDTITLANGSTLTLMRGDITASTADAIVNAANAYLVAGGGVSGAIHAAAGPALKSETAALALEHGPLRTCEALVTGGHQLRAKHVVHALGPVWTGGSAGEADALAATYRNALVAADTLGDASIAFPSISTGIFGYPLELAAPVALHAVSDALLSAHSVRSATVVLYDERTYDAFATAMEAFSAR